MHNACAHNEYVALRNRVMQETPKSDPTFNNQLFKWCKKLGNMLGPHKPSSGDWIQKYSGRKLTLYQQAQERVDSTKITTKALRRISRLSSFIKPEKISDDSRDPRMIQARSLDYNYMVGNFLKPIEHKLYAMNSRRFKIVPGKGRVIAKNLNLQQRAKHILAKFNQFRKPICYSIDCSRFDAHVTTQQLEAEFQVYLGAYRGEDRSRLHNLLKQQLCNRGVTKHGIVYTSPGGRSSGDMNTALGNCILMTGMLAVCSKVIGFKRFDLFVDGDDTLIFASKDDEQAVHQMVSLMSAFGHEVKLENRAERIEDIVHCQAKLVETANGPIMCQDPVRVLSRTLVSHKHWGCSKPKKQNRMWCLGTCLLSVFAGVPVLQGFAISLLRAGRPGGLVQTSRMWSAARELNSDREYNLDIPEATYLNFCEVFNWTMEEVRYMESLFETIEYDLA